MKSTIASSILPPGTPKELLHYFESIKFKTTTLKKVGLTTGFFNFSDLIFIKKGRFSISFPHSDLSTVFSFIIEPNSWFGALTFMSSPHPFVLINELEDAELLYISNSRLSELAEKNPLIYKWLLHVAADNIPKWFQAQLISFSHKKDRVIYCLATLVSPNNVWNENFELNVTQQELSELCGLSRPRVNEVLKDLEQQEFICVKHKRVTIKQPNALFSLLDEANLGFYDPREK